MAEASRQPVVSGSQVFAAGLASAGAALVTSKFGVAGTLLGAALTTMLITGGSAILKAYLETLTGSVRKVPRKMRARRERWKAGRAEAPEAQGTVPGRPDLRENFVGRMRAAFAWFSHLPTPSRRSIMIRGSIAAAAALVISLGTIFLAERAIGNSLSCGLWAECPEGANPGIHLGETRGTGAGTSFPVGGSSSGNVPQQDDSQDLYQDPAQQPAAPADPGVQPADPNVPAEPAPAEPVAPAEPAPQPVPGETPSQTPAAPAPSGTPSEAAPVE